MLSSKFIGVLAILGFFALHLAGCASLLTDEESDIPWNAPQQWEGAPAIPGMDGY